MSRYYYYLIFINMVANIIASVPVILMHYRKDGTVISMIIAIIIGMIQVIIYTRFFNSFPGMTLPDLLKKSTSKWFYIPFQVILAFIWFVAGTITIVTFTFLLKRFLTPDMEIWLIGSSILVFVLFGCLMKTDRILYTIEIILTLTFPLILFIFLKAYGSNYINWDYVKIAARQINHMPNLIAFSACFYLFLGTANLFIFNRFFTTKQNFRLKQISIIGLMMIVTLFTTYFIPIGFNGFNHIDELVYPWISTSDSLRMKYGFIERVLFVFLLFYLAIAFLSILVHWHVCTEFLKYTFNLNNLKWKGFSYGQYIPVVVYPTLSLYLILKLDEYQLIKYTGYFYVILFLIFPLVALLLWYIKRRMKDAVNEDSN